MLACSKPLPVRPQLEKKSKTGIFTSVLSPEKNLELLLIVEHRGDFTFFAISSSAGAFNVGRHFILSLSAARMAVQLPGVALNDGV
jgi:hypothetical protein